MRAEKSKDQGVNQDEAKRIMKVKDTQGWSSLSFIK